MIPSNELNALELRYSVMEDILPGLLFLLRRMEVSGLIDRCKEFGPDVVMLEQPFLWPIFHDYCSSSGVFLVYSSHNVEARMKSAFYDREFDCPIAKTLTNYVEVVERNLVDAADLVVCVTEDDKLHWGPNVSEKIVIVPNASDRPNIDLEMTDKLAREISNKGIREYAFFVGSDHIPNAVGFMDCIGKNLSFLAPDEGIVVMGGVNHALTREGFFDGLYGQVNRLRTISYEAPSDSTVDSALMGAKVVLLPIASGGGSNLKTAQAILSGKRILATEYAFRGYSDYRNRACIVNIQDFRNTMKLMMGDDLMNGVVSGNSDTALTWDYQINNYSKILQSRFEKEKENTSLAIMNHWDISQELNLQQLASYLGHGDDQNCELGEEQEAIFKKPALNVITNHEHHRYPVMDWVGRFFTAMAKEDNGEFIDSINELLLNYDNEVPKLYKKFKYIDVIWGRVVAVQRIIFSKDFIDRYCAWSKKKRFRLMALRKAYSAVLSPEAVIRFASARRDILMIAGFSYQETWGCWSNSRKSVLSLNLKGEDDASLSFKVQAFAASERRPLIVYLSVNKHKITTWRFNSNIIETVEVSVTIPRKQIASNGEVILEFSYSHVVSPKQLGINEDARELALGFIEIRRK